MQRFLGFLMRVMMAGSAVLLLSALFVGSASAHAHLVSSTPSDGQVLTAEPATVSAVYEEETSLTKTKFDVYYAKDSTAPPQLIAQGTVDVNVRTHVSAALPANLGDGVYTVKWHTLTEDDNGMVDGTFSFTVASGQPPSGPTGKTGNQQEVATATATPGAPSGGGTLPTTGQPSPLLPAGLVAALALLGVGLRLRRRALR
ncbi:MAG TPA: copper resistance protein CopC [Chloroflexia bacterium]|nr:copper resistance protein CopC [Chloroflexia bacterium]